MADQSDVEDALVRLAFDALYPQGQDSPSICGAPCRIYRGWPNPAALDADLAGGRVNVTVFPAGTGQRPTTRYPDEWNVISVQRPTLTATVNGTLVSFAGTAAPGQVAGIVVDGRAYSYRIQDGDDPAMVAARLAALSRQDAITTLSRQSLSVPGALRLSARVVADATVMRELRRQEMDFRIACWCPSPLCRDEAASAIDQALSNQRFVAMPDGALARLIFKSSAVIDQAQDAALYRRDLICSVEYATTETAVQPAMLFGSGTVNAAAYIA